MVDVCLWLVWGLVVAVGFSFVVVAASITIIQIISFAEEVAASSSAAVTHYYCCNVLLNNRRAGETASSQFSIPHSCTFSFSRYTREEIFYPLKIVCLHTIMSLSFILVHCHKVETSE